MKLKDYPLTFAVAGLVTAAALVANVLAQPRSAATPIDLSEAKAKEEARFQVIDADGDGLVSAEEFAAADPRQLMAGLSAGGELGEARRRMTAERRSVAHERVRAVKERHQAEHEGRDRVARREARQRAERREAFETADTDDDGQLSTEEYEHLPAKVEAERRQRMFARLDANGDGSLTPDEFPSVVNRLEMLDADGDGLVTRDEMRAARGR